MRYATRASSLALVGLAACASTQTSSDPTHAARIRAEVADALERYQVAARTTDPDRISAFYTATGVLLEPGIAPIQGRAAIRTFIASFPGVRVDVATATPERIEVFGDTALVWGAFFERLAFPGQPLRDREKIDPTVSRTLLALLRSARGFEFFSPSERAARPVRR